MSEVHTLFIGLLLRCYVTQDKDMGIVVLQDYREKSGEIEVRYWNQHKPTFKVKAENCTKLDQPINGCY